MTQDAEHPPRPVCAKCGAKLVQGQVECWLCGAEKVPAEGVPGSVTERVYETAGETLHRSEGEVQWASILLPLVVGLVIVGLFKIAPILGWICLVAFLPMFLRILIGLVSGKSVSDAAVIKYLSGGLAAVMAVLSVLFAVVVAAVIAFLAVCAEMLRHG